jgi:hypothetical protein
MPSQSLAAYAVKNLSMVANLGSRTPHSIWSKRGGCCGLSLHRTRAVVLSERESWSNGKDESERKRRVPLQALDQAGPGLLEVGGGLLQRQRQVPSSSASSMLPGYQCGSACQGTRSTRRALGR